MIISRIVAAKLRASKIDFVLSSKDMTNAFPSPKHEKMDDKTDARTDIKHQHLFFQRRHNQITRIKAWDKEVDIRMGSGGMQGDGFPRKPRR